MAEILAAARTSGSEAELDLTGLQGPSSDTALQGMQYVHRAIIYCLTSPFFDAKSDLSL